MPKTRERQRQYEAAYRRRPGLIRVAVQHRATPRRPGRGQVFGVPKRGAHPLIHIDPGG